MNGKAAYVRSVEQPPNQPTDLVRCPCATAGCKVVGVGRTWDDARRALYLDHAKVKGHALPNG